MICEACGAENPSDSSECEFCQTPLEVVDELTGELVNGFHSILDDSKGETFIDD